MNQETLSCVQPMPSYSPTTSSISLHSAMTNRSATASLFTVVGMPKFVWSWQFLAFNQMDKNFLGRPNCLGHQQKTKNSLRVKGTRYGHHHPVGWLVWAGWNQQANRLSNSHTTGNCRLQNQSTRHELAGRNWSQIRKKKYTFFLAVQSSQCYLNHWTGRAAN